MRHHAGFTLIELVVVLAVIGILALAVTPAIVQQIGASRIEGTRAEQRILVEGMIGRQDQPGNFGFAGDLGRLPQSFTELAQRGSLPSYTTATTRSVGMGWNGPYVNVGTSSTDYLSDEFGRPYTGAASGQVVSSGPDGAAGTADDLTYPPTPAVIIGRISITLKTEQGSKTLVDPSGYEVQLYYSNGGVEAMLTDNSAPFVFENVPMGLHAVKVVKTSPPNIGSTVALSTIVSQGMSRTTAAELWF